MTMRLLSLFALVASLVSFPIAAADRQVEDYSAIMGEFKKSAAVAPFFGSAYGYAVFPKIGKGGLGIGASHGKGQVYRGGKVVGFTSTSDISIGFQAGGQAYAQVIFFQDKKTFDNFTSGEFEFAASASAIAIQSSAEAKTGSEQSSAGAAGKGEAGKQTAAEYQSGILVFTKAHGGLMYAAAIAGQKYTYKPVE